MKYHQLVVLSLTEFWADKFLEIPLSSFVLYDRSLCLNCSSPYHEGPITKVAENRPKTTPTFFKRMHLQATYPTY